MQPPSAVTDYLDRLTRELSFDHALARRVRREAEDHLCTAVAELEGAPDAAQRRAIADFGDPRDLACQYAALSLFRQTRRVGSTLVFALAGIFAVMRLRAAWYRFLQSGLDGDGRHMGSIVLSIDVYAFKMALAVGLIGFCYISLGSVPVALHQRWRSRATTCIVLCVAAAGALLVSVLADTALTALRLSGASLSASVMVPVASVVVEFAVATLLLCQVRTTFRRMAWAKALLRG